MTPVSTPTPTDHESATGVSLFSSFSSRSPFNVMKKNASWNPRSSGFEIYPEKSFLVLRLKMSAAVTPDCYANVSRYLKESLPGVNRVVLDVHYAAPVLLADYLASHEKELLFLLS